MSLITIIKAIFSGIIAVALYFPAFTCLSYTGDVKNLASSYAVPQIEGNYHQKQGHVIRMTHVDYKAVGIVPDDPASKMVLKWNGIRSKDLGSNALFRLTLVSDPTTRNALNVSTVDNIPIANMDASMGVAFQVLQCTIPDHLIGSVVKHGLQINASGDADTLFFFGPGSEVSGDMLPHLLIPGQLSPYEEFFNRMASPGSMGALGWEMQCVIDGLAALAQQAEDGTRYQETLERHLLSMFPTESPIVHPPKTYGAEGTGVVAQLAYLNPHHPEVHSIIDLWEKLKERDGLINDYNQLVAETNYTVAYPLAVLAKLHNRSDFSESAILELRKRRDALVDEHGAIWLRRYKNLDGEYKGNKTYRLWSRGLAWYTLGLAKTLDELPEAPEDLIRELQRATSFLMDYQTPEGMWRLFADRPKTINESSGTAGIAAAMAIGVRRGWLGPEADASAKKAFEGLKNQLTPDGFITGTSPSNKHQGGEVFQAESQGIIGKWGMGLFAQLAAELNPPKH